MVDQNGSQHDYEFDGFGRPTSDTVSKTGSTIATDVLRINTQYEIRDMVNKVTSYSDATGTAPNVVNEVAKEETGTGPNGINIFVTCDH